MHKGSGSRSQSRPESPTGESGGMPALPSSRHALLAGGNCGGYAEGTEDPEMIDAGNVNAGSTIQSTTNNNSHRAIAPVVAVPSCPPDKNSSETDTKNFRNRVSSLEALRVNLADGIPMRETIFGSFSISSNQLDLVRNGLNGNKAIQTDESSKSRPPLINTW